MKKYIILQYSFAKNEMREYSTKFNSMEEARKKLHKIPFLYKNPDLVIKVTRGKNILVSEINWNKYGEMISEEVTMYGIVEV